MKNKVACFINSNHFIIFIFLLSLISWHIGNVVDVNFDIDLLSFIPLAIISFVVAIYSKDGFPFVPILINAFVLPRINNVNLNNIPISVIIFGISYLSSMIIFILKNKVNIFVGKFKWSYLTIFTVFTLVSFRLPTNAPNYLLIFTVSFPLYLFIYLFFSSVIISDSRILVAKSLMWTGILVFTQSLNYLIITPYEVLKNQILNGLSYTIYWSNPNIGAIFLLMIIGMTFYLIIEYPNIIIYKISLILQIITLLLTVSRAGILLLFLSLIIYFIILYIIRPNKIKTIYSFLLMLVFIGILIRLYHDLFTLLINHFISSFNSDDPTSGRVDLLIEAFNTFKENLWFGNGFFSKLDEFETVKNGVIITNYSIYSYHSMPLQVAACSGLVGIIAVMSNYLLIFKFIIKNLNKYNLFALVIFILMIVYSLIDNVFLEPHYMIVWFIILGTIESSIKFLKITNSCQ